MLDFVSKFRERLHHANSLAKESLLSSQTVMKSRNDRSAVLAASVLVIKCWRYCLSLALHSPPDLPVLTRFINASMPLTMLLPPRREGEIYT